MAAASRTQAPDLARELLRCLRLGGGVKAGEVFDWVQIYPGRVGHTLLWVLCWVCADHVDVVRFVGSKTTHFSRLQKQSGISYDEMLFFDDEVRNKNVEELGVVMYLVRDGVTRDVVDRGVREWRRRKGREAREA